MPKNELIKFVKMHGLGNDFVVIDTISNYLDTDVFPVKRWADRHFGIGFDQLLVIETSNIADFYCHIYNADGSQAEQCGNGLRCVGRYLWQEKVVKFPTITLETIAGMFTVEVKNYKAIRLSMGIPEIKQQVLELMLGNKNVTVHVVSMGNPHAIVVVDNINAGSKEKIIKEIKQSGFFPEGVNIGFMQIVDSGYVRLRTYERGSGETHACGSNAAAAAVIGISNGWLDHQVEVEFKYGSLIADWQGKKTELYMTGPAEWIYTGDIYVNP